MRAEEGDKTYHVSPNAILRLTREGKISSFYSCLCYLKVNLTHASSVKERSWQINLQFILGRRD